MFFLFSRGHLSYNSWFTDSYAYLYNELIHFEIRYSSLT